MAETQVFTILLFAMLREKAGNSIQVELPAGPATAQQLLSACSQQHPQLAAWLPHVKVAVNRDYAELQQAVSPSDEIALIPPVAGG
jgi:molybdopterin converting factor subunit 1